MRGQSFREAAASFAAGPVRECLAAHPSLLKSRRAGRADRKRLGAIAEGHEHPCAFLVTLCRALHEHWQKKVVILIDDCDAPLLQASSGGYFAEMQSFMGTLLGAALKSSVMLRLAVLTGSFRLPLADHGLNNVAEYGIEEARYADCFGFGASDVAALLSRVGLEERAGEIRELCGGFRFGRGITMHCPRDVMRHVARLLSAGEDCPEQSRRARQI
ncbi:MAG: AAA family ATPase [Desulfovibrionaceae bacterium]|nr:AAA family ATPase [Desulfovibrionaceae bacterium]